MDGHDAFGISKSLKPAHVEALTRVAGGRYGRVNGAQKEYAMGRLHNDALQWGAQRSVRGPGGKSGKPTDEWRLKTRYDRVNNKRAMTLATKTPYKKGGYVMDSRKRVLP